MWEWEEWEEEEDRITLIGNRLELYTARTGGKVLRCARSPTRTLVFIVEGNKNALVLVLSIK